MRALVTGGAGFIGSHLASALLDAGHDVTIFDDLSTGKNLNARTNFFTYDVTNTLFGVFDTIFHCAARASIPNSLSDPFGSSANNIGGIIQVLELARKTGAKVVFSSSSSIYGDVQTPYSLQKSIGEQYMKLYWETWGVKSVALRYFNVYGERQPNTGAYALALAIFLDQKKNNEPFTIVGTGEQRRDFVYVGDVAKANMLAGEYAEGFDVFDVGTGVNQSINEIADMIDPKHPRVQIPPRIEPMANLADTTKFLPGWQPTVTIQEWLKSV